MRLHCGAQRSPGFCGVVTAAAVDKCLLLWSMLLQLPSFPEVHDDCNLLIWICTCHLWQRTSLADITVAPLIDLSNAVTLCSSLSVVSAGAMLRTGHNSEAHG